MWLILETSKRWRVREKERERQRKRERERQRKREAVRERERKREWEREREREREREGERVGDNKKGEWTTKKDAEIKSGIRSLCKRKNKSWQAPCMASWGLRSYIHFVNAKKSHHSFTKDDWWATLCAGWLLYDVGNTICTLVQCIDYCVLHYDMAYSYKLKTNKHLKGNNHIYDCGAWSNLCSYCYSYVQPLT